MQPSVVPSLAARRAAALLALAAVLVSACGAQHAAAARQDPVAGHWRGADPSGDVTGSGYRTSPKPCGTTTPLDGHGIANVDLTGVTIDDEGDSVTVVATYATLIAAAELSLDLEIRTPTATYPVLVSPGMPTSGTGQGGELRGHVYWPGPAAAAPSDSPGACGSRQVLTAQAGRGPCPGAKADLGYDRSTVTVVVPRTCMHDPPWVEAAVSASATREDQPSSTLDIYEDAWGSGTPGDPEFSPEVTHVAH